MLRSLFAGISGLRVNQTMLDVTGNNIANANTTGFKSAPRRSSQDTLSQMLTAASGANTNRGGTNPIQVGLGVQLAATNTQLHPGLDPDHRAAHRPDDPGRRLLRGQKGNEQLYTRAGCVHLRQHRHPGDPGRQPGAGLRARRRRAPTGGLIDVTLDTTALIPPVPGRACS